LETLHEPVALLTVEDVCDRLRVSRATVYRKIMAGELGAVRLGRGPNAHLRVPEDRLERFLSAHAREAAVV
jgi:excisionase family DNA binding protein